MGGRGRNKFRGALLPNAPLADGPIFINTENNFSILYFSQHLCFIIIVRQKFSVHPMFLYLSIYRQIMF